MAGFARIVCGLDGSPEGLEAARQAHALAGDDGRVIGVAVWDPSFAMHAGVQAPEFTKRERERAAAALKDAEDEIPDIETKLLRSREVAGLLVAAENFEADLLAVGIRGRSRFAGAALGSVATGIARHAPSSVLLSRPAPADFPGAILQPTDGSGGAQEATRIACAISTWRSVPLTILEVGNDESSGQAAAAALGLCPEAQPRTVSGTPHKEIADVAAQTQAGLVVMGSRGLTGLRALGSVSERVAHGAPCSVLIVREPVYPDA